jgi:hypothetical protein
MPLWHHKHFKRTNLLERFSQRTLVVRILLAGFLLKIICAPHCRMIRCAKDLWQQFHSAQDESEQPQHL